jgi:WD40 repeat protein
MAGGSCSSSTVMRTKCSSPDGRRLTSSGSDNTTIVWDISQ